MTDARIFGCAECDWMGLGEDADDDSQKWLVCPECGGEIKLLHENEPDTDSGHD